MCPTKRPYMVYHIYAVLLCYIVDLCYGVNPCYVVNICHSFIHIIVLCYWPLSRRPTVPKATFIEYCFKYQFGKQLHPWLTKQICEGYRCLDWHWWLNWRWWRRQDSGDTGTQGDVGGRRLPTTSSGSPTLILTNIVASRHPLSLQFVSRLDETLTLMTRNVNERAVV